jgi:hypothetical protein
MSTWPESPGRLRSGVTFKIEYWVQVDKPGVYFIKYTVPVDMDQFIDERDSKEGIITWSDGTFVIVNEHNGS